MGPCNYLPIYMPSPCSLRRAFPKGVAVAKLSLTFPAPVIPLSTFCPSPASFLQYLFTPLMHFTGVFPCYPLPHHLTDTLFTHPHKYPLHQTITAHHITFIQPLPTPLSSLFHKLHGELKMSLCTNINIQY